MLQQPSLYLAGLGFSVEAIDVSDVAIGWLREEAARRKMNVVTRCEDIETVEFTPATYEVVVCLNFLERSVFPKLVEALAPGGLLIFETMTQDHVDVLKKKFNRRFLLEKGELSQAFPQLGTIAYREEVVSTGGGASAVASLLARKP